MKSVKMKIMDRAENILKARKELNNLIKIHCLGDDEINAIYTVSMLLDRDFNELIDMLNELD